MVAEPTDEEVRAMFDGPVLRCECGHVYEAMPEQQDAEWTDDGDPINPLELDAVIAVAQTLGASALAVLDWRCPACGRTHDAPALVTVNHLDEYERAWEELGEQFAMIVERLPEMRDVLEEKIDEAREHAESILASVFRGASGST